MPAFTRTSTVAVASIVWLQSCLLLSTPAGEPSPGRVNRTASDEAFMSDVLPLVQKYCVDCHGADEPEGGVSLHGLKRSEQILESRDTWARAIRVLRVDGMPPKDYGERPSHAERLKMLDWLDLKLFHVDCDVADDAGRVTIHRLNRTEYTNTVRDLLGVDIDPAKGFPSDDVGYGFNNIADVLSLPPLLFEKYVDASEEIAASTILTNASSQRKQKFGADQFETSGAAQARNDAVRMSSHGSAILSHVVRVTGDYVIRVQAAADQAGPDPARMEIRVDGKAIKVHDIRGHREAATYEVSCRLEQGRRRIEAAFVNDYYKPDARDPADRDRNLTVVFIELQGPTNAATPEVHKRIVFTRPGDDKSVEQASREIFSRLMPRAFRRPIDDSEVERVVRIVRFAVDRGDSFERGIQAGLQGILVSPHFLFRIEDDSRAADAAEHSINDYELASRLSYFLWSTMPDEELFRLAEQAKLHNPQMLDAQIERMLADPKADALVDNFASQWLTLSNIVESQPDQKLFPEFTPELRADMVQETKMFIRSIFREDRSLLEFLDADFTFVNERLAKHYNIDGVKGEEFRRVSLPKDQRAGVLTHASILTITSNPDRTSLVRRGVWILDQILGMELPDPPGNVPSLEEGARKSGATSMREQLKIHREMPTCAVCHDTMDPLGFGFENFDPIGRWRTEAEGQTVDAGGTLPSGESFSGPVELAAILKKRKNEFTEFVTKKMLTYALGRGLEIPDSCAIDDIVTELSEQDYRFKVLVRGIVHSKPFLMRRGDNE